MTLICQCLIGLLLDGIESMQLYSLTLINDSPLRKVDPRVKLVVSIACSLVVMMSLQRLLVFLFFYLIFIIWGRLLKITLKQIWNLKWLFLILFIVDTVFVDVTLAIIVSLRLILLIGILAIFTRTTTAEELRLALEQLGIPYRYAFSLSIAFQSINLVQHEWQSIIEAQQARGIIFGKVNSMAKYITQIKDLVSLSVPAIVLTTRRAWAITEAASARGFDAPHRKPYHHPI